MLWAPFVALYNGFMSAIGQSSLTRAISPFASATASRSLPLSAKAVVQVLQKHGGLVPGVTTAQAQRDKKSSVTEALFNITLLSNLMAGHGLRYDNRWVDDDRWWVNVDHAARFTYSGMGEIGLQGRILPTNRTAPPSISAKRRSKTPSRVQARGTVVDPNDAAVVQVSSHCFLTV